jgi:competence protein ComEA
MKRKLFFLFDKLKISRNERMAVSVLMVLLASIFLANKLINPSSPYNEKDYQKLDKKFQKRAAILKRKEHAILSRYKGKPSSKAAENSISTDTVKQKSTKTKKINPQHNAEININTSGLHELQKLPGVGPATARRIIQYRKKKGVFKSTSELLEIKGIGHATLKKMEPFIFLKGMRTKPSSLSENHSQDQKTDKVSKEQASSDHSPININTANAQELESLPGIGPSLSHRIITYRKKNGFYKSKSTLLKIKGVGKKTLAKIKPFIKLRE